MSKETGSSSYFAQAELDRPFSQMTDFIEEHRGVFGVEPICRVLPIAPSTYHQRVLEAREPDRASARSKSDAALRIEIARVWEENRELYGARKVWRALRREGFDVARCTVERLMKGMGIKGVVRGRRIVTTNPDAARPCPEDKVNRQFKAARPRALPRPSPASARACRPARPSSRDSSSIGSPRNSRSTTPRLRATLQR